MHDYHRLPCSLCGRVSGMWVVHGCPDCDELGHFRACISCYAKNSVFSRGKDALDYLCFTCGTSMEWIVRTDDGDKLGPGWWT